MDIIALAVAAYLLPAKPTVSQFVYMGPPVSLAYSELQRPTVVPTPTDVAKQIAAVVVSRGLDPTPYLAVSYCESGWNPTARNGQFTGVFQIGVNIHHLTSEQAEDVTYATNWTIDKVQRDGGWGAWSCKP